MADKKRQKRLIWILVAIIVVAVGFLYLNFEYLTRSPFDTVVEFDEPYYAAMNEDGYKSLIDSAGSRVLVLSPENEITAVIEYSALSANAPRLSYCLAMDNSRVYILDSLMNPDGTSLDGERILTYDFNGKYLGTLISTSATDGEDQSDEGEAAGPEYQIISISCDGDRIYAACGDKGDINAVIVADVTDGIIEPIHSYSCTAGVPFEFTYQPEQDITTVITYDGKICTWGLPQGEDSHYDSGWLQQEGEPVIYKPEGEPVVYKPEGQIDKVLYGNDGGAVTLDSNEDTLSRQSYTEPPRVLVHTAAESFDMCGKTLIFADPNEYSVSTYDLDTKEGSCISKAAYKSRIRVRGYIAWLMALVAAGSLITLIVQLAIEGRRKHKEQETLMPEGPRLMTTGRLYGNTFLVMFIAFVITAFALGRYYYNNALDKARADVIGTAYRIKMTSPDGFGDKLAAVESQEDFGSSEYQAVYTSLATMCLVDAPAEPRTAMSSTVYRFIDGSDDIIMVIDPQDYNRIGTLIDARDQERKQIKEGLGYVREGYFNEAIVDYDNGVRLYQIYAPVYDSTQKLVGVAIVAFNESGVIEDIKLELATRLLEIFTLLAGLCMLVAEIRFAMGVSGIQKERHRRGIYNTTVIEADRTINILLRIPSNIFLIFYTLIVYGILKNNGMANNAFLLALPVTLEGIAFAVMRTTGSSIVKHEPKKFMYIATAISIVGLGICIVASIYNSYVLIIIGGIIESLGSGLAVVAGRATKLSGKKPVEEYSLMVFANMETAIASAIGASLGAVVRGIYGDTGLMILAILMALVAFPVISYFVGDDIAVPRNYYGEDKDRKPSLISILIKDAGVLLKPKIVIATFLLTLPIGFLALFSSYVLPLLNEYEGLPDVVIGAVTFGIQLLTLFVIPNIVKWVLKSGATNTYVTAIFMAITAVVLLIFGADGTMKTFIVALLVIAVIKTLLPNMVDDIYIEEADKAGVVVNDLMTIYEAAHSVGNYVGPLVLSFMMLSGVSSLGYWWGIICAVCAALIVLISSCCLSRSDSGRKSIQIHKNRNIV